MEIKSIDQLYLHHDARRIHNGQLEQAIKIFEHLGFIITYRPPNSNTWAMVKYPGIEIRIQLIETEDAGETSEQKKNSHIGLVSSNPKKELSHIKEVITEMGLSYIQGGRSDKEFYFDCPEVFTDFVVEIMDTSVI